MQWSVLAVPGLALYILTTNVPDLPSTLTSLWHRTEVRPFNVFFIFTLPFYLYFTSHILWRIIRQWVLIRNGAVAEGMVVEGKTEKGERTLVASFRDSSGREWLHKLPVSDFALWEGMPIAVFYDPRNPARNLTLENSQLDLVISTDTRPLTAILRRP